jgi:hypothetical protein
MYLDTVRTVHLVDIFALQMHNISDNNCLLLTAPLHVPMFTHHLPYVSNTFHEYKTSKQVGVQPFIRSADCFI